MQPFNQLLGRMGLRLALSCVVAGGMVGCVMHTSSGGDNEDAPVTRGDGALVGRVNALHHQGGQPVSSTVTIGGQQVETNEQGWFVATGLSAGEGVLVEIEADGYVSTQKIVSVMADTQTFLDVRLFKRSEPQLLDAGVGGELRFGPAKIVMPPDAIVDGDGQTFSGNALVSVSNVDPSVEGGELATPGDFTVLPGQSTADQRLETYGMAELYITDETGEELGLDADIGSTLSIPLPSGIGSQLPPEGMPLWYYDPTVGHWVEMGDLAHNAGENTYDGVINSTGTWNADILYDSACVTGRIVKPDGSAAPNIKVTSTGIGYMGSATNYTQSNGDFEVAVMASTRSRTVGATLQAQGGGLYLDTPFVVSETPTELASSGHCLDVGEITLAYPIASFVLTWGEHPRDLDSHLTGPMDDSDERFHVYYSRMHVGERQAMLDTDDTSSYGPEVVSIMKAVPGTYVYSIHNYSGESAGTIADSSASITAFTSSGIGEFDASTALQSNEGNDTVWRVFKFDIAADGTVGVLESINEIVDSETSQSMGPAYNP